DRTARVDQERRASRDVAQASELEGDVERVHRLAVPVGEERKAQLERLRPRDVRPGRIAGDAEDAHARLLELPAPVTQELELVRSGRRPVEEVEDEQDRAVGPQRGDSRLVAGPALHARLRGAPTHVRHAVTGASSVAFAISCTTSTMSRFALKTRSWRSEPLPFARMARMPSSSRSAPSSRAWGSISFSVRRTSCATGMRFRLPVARSMIGASSP